MEAIITDIWASPSTLHLRLMVTSKSARWSQFLSVSVPWDKVPEGVRDALQTSDNVSRVSQHDQPLF